jgi:hypothetical protein
MARVKNLRSFSCPSDEIHAAKISYGAESWVDVRTSTAAPRTKAGADLLPKEPPPGKCVECKGIRWSDDVLFHRKRQLHPL